MYQVILQHAQRGRNESWREYNFRYCIPYTERCQWQPLVYVQVVCSFYHLVFAMARDCTPCRISSVYVYVLLLYYLQVVYRVTE
jgi:hypothetical protein